MVVRLDGKRPVYVSGILIRICTRALLLAGMFENPRGRSDTYDVGRYNVTRGASNYNKCVPAGAIYGNVRSSFTCARVPAFVKFESIIRSPGKCLLFHGFRFTIGFVIPVRRF